VIKVREQLLTYYKALDVANHISLNFNFINNTGLDLLERLGEGQLTESDINILKDPSNLVTQHIVKHIFGIKLTKVQKNNAIILKNYTNGVNKPSINELELTKMENVVFIKPKHTQYNLENVKYEIWYNKEISIFFEMNIKGETKEYMIDLKDIETATSGYIKSVERRPNYNNTSTYLDTKMADKQFNQMDVKLIKEEIKKLRPYQIEAQKRKLKKLFKK
jgi:hypothetical protein